MLEAYCQQICDAVRAEMRRIRQAFQQIVTAVTHVQTDLMDKMYNQMCEVLKEVTLAKPDFALQVFSVCEAKIPDLADSLLFEIFPPKTVRYSPKSFGMQSQFIGHFIEEESSRTVKAGRESKPACPGPASPKPHFGPRSPIVRGSCSPKELASLFLKKTSVPNPRQPSKPRQRSPGPSGSTSALRPAALFSGSRRSSPGARLFAQPSSFLNVVEKPYPHRRPAPLRSQSPLLFRSGSPSFRGAARLRPGHSPGTCSGALGTVALKKNPQQAPAPGPQSLCRNASKLADSKPQLASPRGSTAGRLQAGPRPGLPESTSGARARRVNSPSVCFEAGRSDRQHTSTSPASRLRRPGLSEAHPTHSSQRRTFNSGRATPTRKLQAAAPRLTSPKQRSGRKETSGLEESMNPGEKSLSEHLDKKLKSHKHFSPLF